MPDRAYAPSLTDIALFAGLSEADKAAIAATCRSLAVERGVPLVTEGERETSLYLVIAGRFAVTRAGHDTVVCEIGPGQPIGEIGFLTGAPRTATVTAQRDSLVLELNRGSFDELASRHPAVWPALAEALARRLGETTAIARPVHHPLVPRTIAVIPAGRTTLSRAFIARLADALASVCCVRVLQTAADAGLDKEPSGSRGIDQSRATTRLTEMESQCDVLLLVAAVEDRDWNETAIRHADQVIAVAPFDADAELGPLEEIARRFLPPEMHRLVLLHPVRRRITGTNRWLEPRTLAMHHHVAEDSADDIARLVRFLRGTALGLVACGGGALCATHVGAYEALSEKGLTFDIMGGTSAGSAMVAGFILGTSPDEMDRAIHDMFVARRAMGRYTIPRYSLLDHINFDRQLAAFFGGLDIEDLWIPFFAVSSNLSRNTLHVHRQGDLFTAIRASSAIPVMLPPIYTEDGEMLVDGCLLDNVPVSTMHALKGGPNIVVSCSLPEMKRFDVDYGSLPSRGALIRAGLNPLARRKLPDAPNVVSVLMRSLMAGRQDFQRQLRSDDTLIVPVLPDGISYLDWNRHGELRRAGYESARAVLLDGPAFNRVHSC